MEPRILVRVAEAVVLVALPTSVKQWLLLDLVDDKAFRGRLLRATLRSSLMIVTSKRRNEPFK
ncbi:hypothetical protein ISN44_As04g030250 [Arabidopsis suecica]|uniref:Uncharacterized protein n=1 Tax=Arabidopsis suecica TaxID=45249 RepID=A0A8T2EDY9_ARASU|nr:hypothetical protein ISN44_As04g030250 [Arabidopsis suecica]